MTHVFSPVFAQDNPFLAPAVAPSFERAAITEPATPHAGECYALVRSGPPVPEEEVETAATAVEVTVRWGAQVLCVKHLGPGRAFRLGEGADFTLPEDVASSSVELVARRAEGPVVIVPSGAHARIEAKNVAPREASGGEEILLTEEMRVVVEAFAARSDGAFGEPIVFEIASVRAGKVAKVGFMASLAGGALGFIGASFLGHAAIVASLAMFMPRMGADDADTIDRDQMLLMQKLLNASAERELTETPPDPSSTDGSVAPAGGGGGERHMGEEGKAGKTTPVTTHGRMGFAGKDAESKIARADDLRMAQEEGLVGLLRATSSRDPNAPASPWSMDEYQGSDTKSAMGDIFSQNIDDAPGSGGLALNGTGEGGGGKGAGVGLDLSGGIGGGGRGKGFGLGPGDKGGVGWGHGKLPGGHTAKAPIMRTPEIKSNGRLPAEVIQRIVRQNMGRFRLCYENGLRANPGLQGRVSTQFVIGRDGAVSAANDAGSDLPDQKVVQCIVSSFTNLSFPQPEGGIATVVYPLVLSPGE